MSRPQRTGPIRAPQPAAPLPRWAQGAGRPLDVPAASRLGEAFGHDFGAVRVHDDADAATAAQALGARAITFGRHIGFAAGRYVPHTEAGTRLLAHELAHSVQQRGSGAAALGSLQRAEGEAEAAAEAVVEGERPPPLAPRFGAQPQFDLESPGRLGQVHENVFPSPPAGGATSSGGSSALGGQPWVDKGGAGGGTAEAIKKQARAAVLKLKKDKPLLFEPLETNTTDKHVDNDVLVADARLHKRYPQITKTVDPKKLQDAADVYSAKDIVPSPNPGELSFTQAWLANSLRGWTDVSKFAIQETDARFMAMLDELFADAEVGALLKELVLHQSGFIAERGDERTIRINQAASAVQRSRTLVHEVTHFYAHDTYREWLKATADPRTYGEGLTEWLAQKAMTDQERALPGSSYGPRVKRVETEIVAHVPEDDIARAYFQGEVWRLETRSPVARKSFEEASGIKAGAKEKDEIAQSRTGKGLNQEVQRDVHYRFLNLGHDRIEPKPEHVDYFRALKSRLLDAQPAVMLKFVGHTSEPGTWAYNTKLSLARTKAFYKMARDQGIDAKRLPDEAAPEHFGEHKPTLKEDDAQARAFNRRVELFLTGAAAPAGAGKAAAKESEE